MAEKSLFYSRTFWFSLVTGLLAALLPAVPALAPAKDWFAGNSVLLGSVWTMAALVLRLITKDKVVLRE